MWPFSTIRKLRAENKNLKESLDFLQTQNGDLNRLCSTYVEENKDLHDKLAAIELAKREEEYSKRSPALRTLKVKKADVLPKLMLAATKKTRKPRKKKTGGSSGSTK